MASQGSQLLPCYNKGCGNKFDPNDNREDACCFHPGNPVFHDAYKGWSCCNKKSIDFTEFLNIKGCKISFHSNVKPPEPVKPIIDKAKSDEVYEYKAPVPKSSTCERPPFNTPLIKVQPEISNLLRSQIESLIVQQPNSSTLEIETGTSCKNSGCKATYEGPTSDKSECVHHSGVPVFHEGLKYWSCCKKKTTDFSVFLEQVGCTVGEHVWREKKNSKVQSNCRFDWHQTASHVYLSIYAKKYHPEKSTVELNPIRAKVHIVFPADDSQFDQDWELYGVVDVDKSGVSMLPTKVEVKLKKAEPLSWTKIGVSASESANRENVTAEPTKKEVETSESKLDEPVDLEGVC